MAGQSLNAVMFLALVGVLCFLEVSAQGRSRSRARNCVSCSVAGKLFDGHTRFQYEEGCDRFRCVCHCNGSYVCPAKYTENICRGDDRRTPGSGTAEQTNATSEGSSSSSSRRTHSGCTSCVVDGVEHPGHTYFKHVNGCITIDNCICYCNGTWICPASRAKNTCDDGGSGATRKPNNDRSRTKDGSRKNRKRGQGGRRGSGSNKRNRHRGCMNCTVDGKEFKGNAYFDLVQGCKSFKYCICYCNGSYNCPDRFAKDTCDAGSDKTQGSGTSGCRECSVKGNTFPGNQYFQFTDGCTEYSSCICHCNGSWSCPDNGARNICGGGSGASSQCRDCVIRGQTFRTNSNFRVTDDCIEYNNCNCFCNGSWHCPSNGARDVCNGGSSTGVDDRDNRCRTCVARGRRFKNEYFELTEGCLQFKNCICRCNGSWECPDSGASNICETGGNNAGTGQEADCTTCQVYGSTFPGNAFFEVQSGCLEYNNCFCHCNGSWSCPANSSRNVCTGEGRRGSNTGIRQINTGCKTCFAFGKQFEGNDYFDVIDGCTSFRNCICRCDGSWDCPSRYSSNICDGRGEANTTDNRRGGRGRENIRPETQRGTNSSNRIGPNGCAFCDAKGKMVEGNSYFELNEGCFAYKNCACRCDGSWECPSQFASNICTKSKDTDREDRRSSRCANCVAKGKVVKGGASFELVDGCNLYRSCRCSCDGSWECSPEHRQDICFGNATNLEDRCSVCKSSDGNIHPPNKRFSFVDECIEYNCDCHCNGSWDCPGDRSRWVCTDRCLKCDVEGRKVENNTVFTHKTGCLEYTCNCFCNGSWSCPGNTVRNTCPAGVRNNCNQCVVSPQEKYEGESDFVLKQGCLHYQCRCNCDGTYKCPGKDARNVCRGEKLGGCRSCVVSDTEVHQGNTDFALRRDCFHYQCRCNCDGSWNCPIDKASDICVGEVPGGCKVCRVSDTEVYRNGATFDLRKGCIHYKCKCNCDGGWLCPAEDSRNICKGEIPGGCRSCIISDNEFYPGNTEFEMVKDCIHYSKCACNCDGSYRCSGRFARRVCASDGGPIKKAPVCRTCKVEANKEFNGNTTFRLDRACHRYECTCNCDGSWECPSGKTTNICTNSYNQQRRREQCSECKIGRAVYPGNTVFKYSQRCYQFDCKCDCNGRWSCDHKNPVNTCKRRDQESYLNTLTSQGSTSEARNDYSASNQGISRSSKTGSSIFETDIQSNNEGIQNQYNRNRGRNTQTSRGDQTQRGRCTPCVVGNRALQVNTAFNVDAGCTRYERCICRCDGKWTCAKQRNTCGGAGERSSTVPIYTSPGFGKTRTYTTEVKERYDTKSKRKEIESSAWVDVGGHDSTFVKTGENPTGGGYKVKVDTRYSQHYPHGVRLGKYEIAPSADGSSTYPFADTSNRDQAGISSTTRGSSGTGHSQCVRCEVDEKSYPTGANFDMRRGCVVYKCLCLCSGSYRCRVTSDNACTSEDKQRTCSNCLYKGMVFPGDMGFTVREGCIEKECQCNCDGTYECSKTRPIEGCTAATENSPGFSGYGSFYPVHHGLVPAASTGSGHITNPSQGYAIYQSTCPSCGSGAVVYHKPVHPASGPHTNHQAGNNGACNGCNVNGEFRPGNSAFTFEKDCIEFDCYCACGGSWKCSGRMALQCTPGFEPDAVPHTSSKCKSCIVQGTHYPPKGKFSMRQGCYEYKCVCNCDGGWSCPQQQPHNLCPPEPERPQRGSNIDPQILKEDTYFADQSRDTDTSEERESEPSCLQCNVGDASYEPKSPFVKRDGCIIKHCECHCNGTWTCPAGKSVDTCKLGSRKDTDECKDCLIGSEVFISEKDFQLNRGCFQHNCHCFCNGSYDCPAAGIVNICSIAGQDHSKSSSSSDSYSGNVLVHPALETNAADEVVTAGDIAGCKDCQAEGRTIKSLGSFVRQVGCYETLCMCQCNGKPSCPPSASINVCELQDSKPQHERTGCLVEKRRIFTRVFAHVQDCVQRTCVCHDNGSWSCKKTANDIIVC